MANTEATINGKKIGEGSMVTMVLNIKTLIILITIILSGLGAVYTMINVKLNTVGDSVKENNALIINVDNKTNNVQTQVETIIMMMPMVSNNNSEGLNP